MQEVTPFPRRRWLRISLQVILAIITFALVYLIMLPALVSPKGELPTVLKWIAPRSQN